MSISKFDRAIKEIIRLLKEEMTAGSGGVFGTSGNTGGVENSDFYATGDARLPKALGVKKVKGKKKKKVPIQRRPLNKDL